MILDSYFNMDGFFTNKQLLRLFRVVAKHGGAIRFVGGAVRDALAGIDSCDYDLATDLSPDELMEVCQEEGIKTVPIGIKFGTLGVLVGGKVVEVTSLRKDIKSDGRHAEVEFTDDWIEDASRRDLTINAVYADEKGNVFDYFNGIEDLKNGIVRFIGKPSQRVQEDYLRILRFFRFYSMFGKTEIDQKALKACVENKEGLKTLSRERIREELMKLSLTKNFVSTLKIMFDNGILDYILPASDNLDKLQHLMNMTQDLRLVPSPLRRFFVLYNPDEELAENLSDRLHLSRKGKEIMKKWSKIECSAEDFSNPDFRLALAYKYGKDFCIDRMILAYALDMADYKNLSGLIKEVAEAQIPVFPIGGKDILSIVNLKDKLVGVIIKQLEKSWIESGFKLSKEDLLNIADKLFKALIGIRPHA